MTVKNFLYTVLLSSLIVSCKQTNQDLIDKGIKLANRKKFKEAIEVYTKVLNQNPKLQLAHFNRGICFIEIKDYPKAYADFDTIMALQTHGDFIINLNDQSPYTGEEARTQIPFHDALFQLAQVKFYMDSIQSAYKDFQRLIDKNYVKKVFCILWQGTLWYQAGENEKACSFMQTARKLAKTQEEVSESDEMIKAYCK
jgi:tetratricopeptide (TPR) repeat protein